MLYTKIWLNDGIDQILSVRVVQIELHRYVRCRSRIWLLRSRSLCICTKSSYYASRFHAP